MTTKVLPWQIDQASYLEGFLSDLCEEGESTELVEKAYKWATEAHQGQFRKSGESYMSHPLSVAAILKSFEFEETTIVSALLHDVVEDTSVSLEDIKAEFGEAVAVIVDGVTKLDKLSFESEKEAEAASMRKMMVAVAKDIRVLFIKLADRLHNMRTLGVLSKKQRERIANETLRVYAPLANRLGMQELASQLEDLSFAALHSKWYAELDDMVENRAPERELYIAQVGTQVEEKLSKEGIDAQVFGRPKHLWSIYKKVSSGKEFEDLYDLMGLRVIVNSVSDCYAAMGHVHAMWQFLPGRFKDHIAIPKFNLYQSLHTTVMGPSGKLLEIQFRTKEMDDRAERGIAAHWAYKEAGDSDVAWLKRIMDWVEDTSNSSESIDNLHADLEQDEVFVFTPKGDLISLPARATPVDFAYAIHSDIGDLTRGTKINGVSASLSTQLVSGDTIEILTTSENGAGPLMDWLEFVVSRKARNRIRHWTALETQEQLLVEETEAASEKELEAQDPTLLGQDCGILVDGQDDIWVRLAYCCKPTKNTEILGFVTKGRGVSVHTSDCENVVFLSKEEPNRFIQVEWDKSLKPTRSVSVEARALDRSGLLRDILTVLPPQVFIVSMDSRKDDDGVAYIQLELELGDYAQVEPILKTIRMVDAVYDAFVSTK